MDQTSTINDALKLLFAPYKPPPLQRGDRAYCLYRDRLTVITGWTDARIPWPTCRGLESPGGIGPLVDDELARAVRHESAIAICHWWGVGECAVGRWRKALGVGRMDSQGSRRLILSAIQAGITARGDEPPSVETRSDLLWKPEEIALVGVYPDEEVARRIGRTCNAVKLRRKQLGRKNPEYPEYRRLPWTPEHDKLALTLTAEEVSARTGHSRGAVYARKARLRILAATEGQ